MNHVAKFQLGIYHFPHKPGHTSGFLGQDSGFVQEDLMAKIKVVFCHCQNLCFVQLWWWWCSLILILMPKPVRPTCNLLHL
jgi:hypothetical protein